MQVRVYLSKTHKSEQVTYQYQNDPKLTKVWWKNSKTRCGGVPTTINNQENVHDLALPDGEVTIR